MKSSRFSPYLLIVYGQNHRNFVVVQSRYSPPGQKQRPKRPEIALDDQLHGSWTQAVFYVWKCVICATLSVTSCTVHGKVKWYIHTHSQRVQMKSVDIAEVSSGCMRACSLKLGMVFTSGIFSNYLGVLSCINHIGSLLHVIHSLRCVSLRQAASSKTCKRPSQNKNSLTSLGDVAVLKLACSRTFSGRAIQSQECASLYSRYGRGWQVQVILHYKNVLSGKKLLKPLKKQSGHIQFLK